MSKPLNIQEHNASFTKFLIIFFVTVAMVAGALYFDFQVPKKELEILRERSDLLRNQNLAQENYKRTLNEVMVVLSKLDSSSKSMVESELRPKLDQLFNSASIDDSTSSQKLNKVVFGLVNKYMDAKFKLSDMRNFEEEIDKQKRRNAELQRDLDNCNTKLSFNNQR
jgi:Type VI secretion system, TssO